MRLARPRAIFVPIPCHFSSTARRLLLLILCRPYGGVKSNRGSGFRSKPGLDRNSHRQLASGRPRGPTLWRERLNPACKRIPSSMADWAQHCETALKQRESHQASPVGNGRPHVQIPHAVRNQDNAEPHVGRDNCAADCCPESGPHMIVSQD